jgi:hypothetical protein
MKTLRLITYLLLITGSASAQEILYDSIQQRIIIEEKWTGLGKTKEELHNAVKYFASNTFKGGSMAVDMVDPDQGIMITRGLLRDAGFDKQFNLIIRWREGEMKYTVTDIVFLSKMESTFFDQNTYLNKEKQIKPNRKALMKIGTNVHEQLQNALKADLKDDW